ncbi:MAG: glycosyltransferase family 4 protein [Oligoflexia bacterium]|nr:glycosyltransferase family 4 protein [Oligoflexia bacterium]
MKILMLGWEYPPHISGGLGTACEGLTTALGRLRINMDFVVPRLFGEERAPHMRLLAPSANQIVANVQAHVRHAEESVAAEQVGLPVLREVSVTEILRRVMGGGAVEPEWTEVAQGAVQEASKRIRRFEIPSYLSPYLKDVPHEIRQKLLRAIERQVAGATIEETGETLVYGSLMETFEHAGSKLPPVMQSLLAASLHEGSVSEHYSGDLFAEVGRYAAKVLALIQDRDYDLIHAHDWMTFPAGVALKATTGLPLIIHVHSLEYDRSGAGANHRIEEIEKMAMEAADTIVAVSYYTRELIHRRHGISLDKIQVVHNGVYTGSAVKNYRNETQLNSKIVLFLGRVTFQKGPDYFVEAAARVIPHVPDVLFVMAGSGDMLPRMMERVSELGISDKFLFTGFLKGQDVERMFSMADLYVMPSVSEPFGISPLEAIAYNTPVIISKQSGVSEVLSHALKVNFWDVDQLSNLIVSVLKYPELSTDISTMATEEVKRLHWDAAASKTVEIYGKTLGNFHAQAGRG